MNFSTKSDLMLILEFTPLEFETKAYAFASQSVCLLEFTPLEFETEKMLKTFKCFGDYQNLLRWSLKPTSQFFIISKTPLEFTPLEFETTYDFYQKQKP